MAIGVGIGQGVVVGVAVAIPCLGIGRARGCCVSTGEPAGAWQIIPGVHVDEAKVGGAEVVVLVAGVAPAGQVGRWFGAPIAEGVVASGATRDSSASIVGHQAGTAKVVAVQVVEGVGAVDDLDAEGYGAAGNGVGDVNGLGVPAGVFHFVIGEGGVYDGAVGAGSFGWDPAGIISEGGRLAVDSHIF